MELNQENPNNKPTLHLFPAGLSLLCPGLGQLVQGRKIFVLHFGIYALQILPLALLLFDGVDYWTINDTAYFKMRWGVIYFVLLCSILPFFITILFSSLDAAVWKPGQSLPLRRHFTNLTIITVVYVALSALIIPSLSAAREAARRVQCSYHLKQIGLAFHNYHSVYGSFPPAYSIDENGKPLHSWRVFLLPFFYQQRLYDQIRLDEPWNSEHNQQFHDVVIFVYRCPTSQRNGITTRFFPKLDDRSGSCYYSVVIGDETPFPGTASTDIAKFYQGPSNVILVVERPIPVCWMDPNHEIPFDTAAKGVNRDLFGIGSVHSGGANVVFADGLVDFVSETISPEEMQALFTKAAGDVGPCCPP